MSETIYPETFTALQEAFISSMYTKYEATELIDHNDAKNEELMKAYGISLASAMNRVGVFHNPQVTIEWSPIHNAWAVTASGYGVNK